MPCYKPLKGWAARERAATGRRGIVFNLKDGLVDRPMDVPCGQCIGCRLERSRQWAIRCVHEATLHRDNVFITLTYNDENLPESGTLVKKHFQDFMKRLRKHIHPKKVRYYHCGEYGDENHRPHYHALLFGYDFIDKVKYSDNGENSLYISETLNKIWGKGYCYIGSVTFESAAYVARYIMKKITGENAEDHYSSLDLETGEIHKIIPEYTTMSRKPGIGQGWYEKYKDDTYKDDTIVVRGQPMRPPHYYDTQLEKEDRNQHDNLKRVRKLEGIKNKHNSTGRRLIVREKVATSKATQLKRKL
mgnify:CR=1 FL=1